MSKFHCLGAALVCGVLASAALAQRTEVTVSKGAVQVEAPSGPTLVAAGQKAFVGTGGEVRLGVGDPSASGVLALDPWVQAERKAGRLKIDFAGVQALSIDSPTVWRAAALAELPNRDAKAVQDLVMGPTTWSEGIKIYDLEGHLLPCQIAKHQKDLVKVTVRFSKPVPPKELFRFVMVAPGIESPAGAPKMLWREGKLWHARLANDTPNCLNYFQMVLPPTAIFIDATQPVLAAQETSGRPVLTFRNYTGPAADGTVVVRFLWPAQDGTTLADLPPEYRGLGDPRAEEYRQGLQAIAAGQRFSDQSSPIKALLTLQSALVRNDGPAVAVVVWDEKQLKPEKLAERQQWLREYLSKLEVLATPDCPAQPQEGHLHPIYMTTRGVGSHIRVETLCLVFTQGRWMYLGNMGNPRDTDVESFRRFLAGNKR